jgi:hypothetical protein
MAKLTAEFRPPNALTPEDLRAIEAIARRQIDLMDELEAALLASDDLRALGLARQLVGLEKQARGQVE